MRTKLLQVLVVSLLAVALTAGVAYADKPAKLEQVQQLIAESEARVMAAVGVLTDGLAANEAADAALEARVAALEASGGGSAQRPFDSITIGEPVCTMSDPQYSIVMMSIQSPVLTNTGWEFNNDLRCDTAVLVHLPTGDRWMGGPNLLAGILLSPEETAALPYGTTINVEIWANYWGLTDYKQTNVVVSPSPY